MATVRVHHSMIKICLLYQIICKTNNYKKLKNLFNLKLLEVFDKFIYSTFLVWMYFFKGYVQCLGLICLGKRIS